MNKKIFSILFVLLIAAGAFATGIEINETITFGDGTYTGVGMTYAENKYFGLSSGFQLGFLDHRQAYKTWKSGSWNYDQSEYTPGEYATSYRYDTDVEIALYEHLYGDILFVNKSNFNFALELAAGAWIGYCINYGFAAGISPEVGFKFGFAKSFDASLNYKFIFDIALEDYIANSISIAVRYHFNYGNSGAGASMGESGFGNNVPSDSRPRAIIIEPVEGIIF